MAQIVYCAGTSHGPMQALPAELWVTRAQDEMASDVRMLNTVDGRVRTYAELYSEQGDRYASDEIDLAAFTAKERVVRSALDRMQRDVAGVNADIVVVIGNDQDELFEVDNVPALAVYYGDTVRMHPRDTSQMPEWRLRVTRDYGMDKAREYPGSPEFARELIRGLCEQHFDVTALGAVPDPARRGFGHAHGYVAERLFYGSPPPMVPVLINTFKPLNPLPAARCLALGRALRTQIENSAAPARVAVIASGGLSHFVCEEAFDRTFLESLASSDMEALARIPEEALKIGTSEMRSWIVLAGMVEGLTLDWSQYVPVPRTPAGSGQGLGWMCWRPGLA